MRIKERKTEDSKKEKVQKLEATHETYMRLQNKAHFQRKREPVYSLSVDQQAALNMPKSSLERGGDPI